MLLLSQDVLIKPVTADMSGSEIGFRVMLTNCANPTGRILRKQTPRDRILFQHEIGVIVQSNKRRKIPFCNSPA